jgi:hypothetical protein
VSADGIIKLNVNGAYIAQNRAAWAGMILRHGNGSILFFRCVDPAVLLFRAGLGAQHVHGGNHYGASLELGDDHC